MKGLNDLDIIKKMINAIIGCVIWKKKVKEYNVEEDNFFIIYPGEECLCNLICKYLYTYMIEKRSVRCVIFTADIDALKKLKDYFSNNINVCIEPITVVQITKIIDAYWYGELCDHLMILSTRKLYGRNLGTIDGIKNITEEDIFAAGLFNLKLKKRKFGPLIKKEWAGTPKI